VPVTEISDSADARLADFRVVREPDLALNRGVFIAEGRLVVRRLLSESRFATRMCRFTSFRRT
jgi:hypothetical protein